MQSETERDRDVCCVLCRVRLSLLMLLVKMICRNRGIMVVDWIHLAKISILWRFLVNTVIKFFTP